MDSICFLPWQYAHFVRKIVPKNRHNAARIAANAFGKWASVEIVMKIDFPPLEQRGRLTSEPINPEASEPG